ncbi:hypothetical protein ACFQ0M_47025 [Kitasatospora aburaviensis]
MFDEGVDPLEHGLGAGLGPGLLDGPQVPGQAGGGEVEGDRSRPGQFGRLAVRAVIDEGAEEARDDPVDPVGLRRRGGLLVHRTSCFIVRTVLLGGVPAHRRRGGRCLDRHACARSRPVGPSPCQGIVPPALWISRWSTFSVVT